jgi:hypothetical protein
MKKLGHIAALKRRVTRNPRVHARGTGWKWVYGRICVRSQERTSWQPTFWIDCNT